jgi:hypothetical protein
MVEPTSVLKTADALSTWGVASATTGVGRCAALLLAANHAAMPAAATSRPHPRPQSHAHTTPTPTTTATTNTHTTTTQPHHPTLSTGTGMLRLAAALVAASGRRRLASAIMAADTVSAACVFVYFCGGGVCVCVCVRVFVCVRVQLSSPAAARQLGRCSRCSLHSPSSLATSGSDSKSCSEFRSAVPL